MNQEIQEFKKVVYPVIKWMKKIHPHHTIIITSNDAELLEGKISFTPIKNKFEEIEEIPLMKGTIEALNNLSIWKKE